MRLVFLNHQISRQERLEMFRSLCAKKECHPIFWQYDGRINCALTLANTTQDCAVVAVCV